MGCLWLSSVVVLGFVAGFVAGLAVEAAEATVSELGVFPCAHADNFLGFAFALAMMGAVGSAILFGVVKATKLWAIVVIFMGIALGMSIGGIVGITFTESTDTCPRYPTVVPYVGLLSGAGLGAATGGFAYLFIRRKFGLLYAEDEWRRYGA